MTKMQTALNHQIWNGFDGLPGYSPYFSIKRQNQDSEIKTYIQKESRFVVLMDQIHSNEIGFISKDSSDDYQCERVMIDSEHSIGLAPFGHMSFFEANYSCDALVTNDPSIILGVKTADCLPIFIVGDDYFSVIHAGRVGTLDHITKRVCLLLKFLGVTNISVWFGPASCVCCYEIDRDTGTHFDLKLSNQQQIQSVFNEYDYFEPKQMLDCTQCANDVFYSYRSGDQECRNIFYLTLS